jgi:6-pyruvoyltetrahydropterin/6-carboxytetrahydropterin synthase
MKVEIMRSFRIDAGHRVYGHEGKCKNLHGHSYQFDVYSISIHGDLDSLGRVIDFSILKDMIGEWLEHNWDHGVVLWEKDLIIDLWESGELTNHKFYSLPTIPTAENLAQYLLEKANELMKPFDIIVTKVICHETPNCSATATRDEDDSCH